MKLQFMKKDKVRNKNQHLFISNISFQYFIEIILTVLLNYQQNIDNFIE